jgi:hypothetical protein
MSQEMRELEILDQDAVEILEAERADRHGNGPRKTDGRTDADPDAEGVSRAPSRIKTGGGRWPPVSEEIIEKPSDALPPARPKTLNDGGDDEDAPIRFGCVIFDDPKEHSTGWRAVAEEPARRVSVAGTGSLSTDTVWIVNLGYMLSRETGLQENYRFCIDQYLREDICRMATRHGIPSHPVIREPARLCEFAAKIFSRAMTLAPRLLGLGQGRFLPALNMRSGFRQCFPPTRDAVYPQEVCDRIREATSYNCNVERDEWVPREEDVIAHFRIPPRIHAAEVLQGAFPHGNVAEMNRSTLPGPDASREEVQAFLRECTRPAFFKVTCRDIDPHYNGLINFGDSPAGNANGPKRQWLCTPEVVFMASFCHVTIHQAFHAEGTVRLRPQLDFVASIPPRQADLSITVGVILENLWTGMTASSSENWRFRSGGGKGVVNTLAPFLRANDRVRLFEKALQWKDDGYDVCGYATGTLRVSIRGRDPMEVYRQCLKTGMIPPFLGIRPEDVTDPGLKPRRNDPLSFMQYLYATNSLKKLLEVDARLVEELKRNPPAWGGRSGNREAGGT